MHMMQTHRTSSVAATVYLMGALDHTLDAHAHRAASDAQTLARIRHSLDMNSEQDTTSRKAYIAL
jgi:hypothetical protein